MTSTPTRRKPATSSVRINGAALRAIRSRTVDPHTGRYFSGLAFAAAAGISQPHLCRIEGDACKASVSMLHRIASALDVPPAAILWAPPKPGRLEAEDEVA